MYQKLHLFPCPAQNLRVKTDELFNTHQTKKIEVSKKYHHVNLRFESFHCSLTNIQIYKRVICYYGPVFSSFSPMPSCKAAKAACDASRATTSWRVLKCQVGCPMFNPEKHVFLSCFFLISIYKVVIFYLLWLNSTVCPHPDHPGKKRRPCLEMIIY